MSSKLAAAAAAMHNHAPALLKHGAAVRKHVSRAQWMIVGAVYCLIVGGVSVYVLAATRGAMSVDDFLECCSGLWEMILVNLIIPPIALGYIWCTVVQDDGDTNKLRSLTPRDHIKKAPLFASGLLLVALVPVLAVTGIRVSEGRSPKCTALVAQATGGVSPPLLVSVNQFYLASNALFCVGCIGFLFWRRGRKLAEYDLLHPEGRDMRILHGIA